MKKKKTRWDVIACSHITSIILSFFYLKHNPHFCLALYAFTKSFFWNILTIVVISSGIKMLMQKTLTFFLIPKRKNDSN